MDGHAPFSQSGDPFEFASDWLNLPLPLNTEGETLVLFLVLVDLILVLVVEVLLPGSYCGSGTEFVLVLLSEIRLTVDLTCSHKHRFQTSLLSCIRIRTFSSVT